MRLVLASRSPRRREILDQLGVGYEVVVPEVEELVEGEPGKVVVENARRKATAGLAAVGAGEGVVALGVDTDVVLDGRILGKAADEGEARERLEALSGRTHEVLSALVLLEDRGGEPRERAGVERSLVSFRELGRDDLDRYLGSGEWRDRAGAYAIQGLGSALIERVEGDVANVIGLPVRLLLRLAPELIANDV
jgi:septum formation protein